MSSAIGIKDIRGRRVVSNIAMTILLVSFAMLFLTLLLGYVSFRLTSEVWPPMGMVRVPLALPTISTLVIGVSSFFYFLFEKAFNQNNKRQMLAHLVVTFVLGSAFMITQYYLWGSMKDLGLFVEAGVFPSLLYALTWIHAAHIVAALIALLFLIPVIKNGYSDSKEMWVQNIGKFWHFLGIIWFLMYVIMFVF